MKLVKLEIAQLKNRDLRVALNKFLSFPDTYMLSLVFEHGKQSVHLNGGSWNDAGVAVHDKTKIDVSEDEAEAVLKVLSASRSLSVVE